MSDISVCRVCLANNIRMQPIDNTKYQYIYETLTGLKLMAGDGRPHTVCYICMWKLQRFYEFYKMSQNAEKTFVELNRNGVELNQWTVSSLAGVNNNNLSVTVIGVSVYDPEVTIEDPEVDGTTNSEAKEVQVDVKVESIDYEGNENIFVDLVPYFVTGTEPQIDIEPDPINDSDTTQDIKDKKPEMSIDISEPIDKDESWNNTKNSHPVSPVCTVPKVILERIPPDILNQIVHPKQKSDPTVIEFDFYCKECSFRSPSATALLKHSLVHDESRAYACRLCSYRFKSKRSLQYHSMKAHVGQIIPGLSARYTCRICGKTFSNNRIYKNHCLRHDGDLHCEWCNKWFRYKSTYNIHLRTHTGEKPFDCTYCDKTFNCKSNRRKHLNYCHNVEIPFDCKRCGSYFVNQDGLRMHMLDGCSGRLQCKVCGKRYTRLFAFQTHVKSHMREDNEHIEKGIEVIKEKRSYIRKKISGIKKKTCDKFSCEMCDMVFNEKTLLQQHVVAHIL